MDGDNSDERFPPTSGRVLGVLALAVGLGGAGLALTADDVSWGVVAFGTFFAAVAWSALLRPRVAIEGDELVLRNMVDTVRVPLAAVEEIAVRQVLAIRVGDRRYTSSAVGRPRRQMAKDDLRPRGEGAVRHHEGQSLGLYVEERIRARAKDERDRLGIRIASAEQDALAERVTKVPALPEIAWLGGSLVAFVLAVTV